MFLETRWLPQIHNTPRLHVAENQPEKKDELNHYVPRKDKRVNQFRRIGGGRSADRGMRRETKELFQTASPGGAGPALMGFRVSRKTNSASKLPRFKSNSDWLNYADS